MTTSPERRGDLALYTLCQKNAHKELKKLVNLPNQVQARENIEQFTNDIIKNQKIASCNSVKLIF